MTRPWTPVELRPVSQNCQDGSKTGSGSSGFSTSNSETAASPKSPAPPSPAKSGRSLSAELLLLLRMARASSSAFIKPVTVSSRSAQVGSSEPVWFRSDWFSLYSNRSRVDESLYENQRALRRSFHTLPPPSPLLVLSKPFALCSSLHSSCFSFIPDDELRREEALSLSSTSPGARGHGSSAAGAGR